MSAVWHDFNDPTECCARPMRELPIGEGRTSRAEGVTCDGKFEPAVYAHEVYPAPSEYADEPPALGDAVRYHLARALAMYPVESAFDSDDRFTGEWMDRIGLHITERQVACLMVALDKGKAGQEAADFAHAYSSGDTAEVIYDLAREYGVQLDRIKPYPLRSELPRKEEETPCAS